MFALRVSSAAFFPRWTTLTRGRNFLHLDGHARNYLVPDGRQIAGAPQGVWIDPDGARGNPLVDVSRMIVAMSGRHCDETPKLADRIKRVTKAALKITGDQDDLSNVKFLVAANCILVALECHFIGLPQVKERYLDAAVQLEAESTVGLGGSKQFGTVRGF
jgi:prepilin-type processing-associated H-X9-DG protein